MRSETADYADFADGLRFESNREADGDERNSQTTSDWGTADFPDGGTLNSSADNDERDPQTYAIIGAAMEVHRRLGHGFLEAVYQDAYAIELVERGVPFQREVEMPILYRGLQLACSYRADFVCFGEVLVELKTLKQITDIERAQVINYLKATGLQRALLLNFGAASLEHKRFIRNLTPSA